MDNAIIPEAGAIWNEGLYDDQAGAVMAIFEDDDDELVQDVEVYDEAGFLEWIIPAAIADQQRKRNRGRLPLRPGRTMRLGPPRPRRPKTPSRMSTINRRRQGSARLLSMISANQRAINELRGQLGMRSLHSEPAQVGDETGARALIGAQLALAAPGAAGLANFGPVLVRPTNPVRVSTLIAYVYEDAYAAAGATDVAIGPSAPFVVTNLVFGGANIGRSETPALPGELFGVQGGQYGFPIGAGRQVSLAASSPIQLSGDWSPRAQAGANGGDAVVSALAPRLAS